MGGEIKEKETKIKDVKLTIRERAILEILIHEIKELKPNKQISELLDTWIKENKLDLSKVEVIALTTSVKKLRRKI